MYKFGDPEYEEELKRQRDLASLHVSIEEYIDDPDNQKPNLNIKDVFNIETYINNNPDFNLVLYTGFNISELRYLTSVLEQNFVSHRGNKSCIDLETQLFITLSYYSTNCLYAQLQSLTKLSQSTICRVVHRIVDKCFPIFSNLYIPQKTIPSCQNSFKNFPSAVGVVDTTTVQHYRPLKINDQKLTYDFKNGVNGQKVQVLVNPDGQAIHVTIEEHGSMHDKKIFDNSSVKKLLVTVQGQEIETKKIIADKGYTGIQADIPNAIIMKKGKSNENAEYNNHIAADRQIVERWNCRFKQTFNVCFTGYRGDRSYLKNILRGLVALTNYHISLHPLNANDDPKEMEINKMIENVTLSIKNCKREHVI